MKLIYIAHPFGGEQAERIVEKERYRGGLKMKINKITYQHRRDFQAIYECEECGHRVEGDDLYLYLEFDRDVLNSFVDEFQGFVEECGLDCNLQMNGICIDVKNIMCGYGFTMKELWKHRPNDIEFG